jgi:hypothetical protein
MQWELRLYRAKPGELDDVVHAAAYHASAERAAIEPDPARHLAETEDVVMVSP